MGPNADKIAAAAKESGAPVPKSILEAPSLEDSYQARVLDAFWRLSTCRDLGMGAAGPIPWNTADRFASRYGFDYDDIEYDSFMLLIYELDAVFLDHQSKEHKREQARREMEARRGGKAGSFRPAHAGVRRGRPRRKR